MAEPTQARIAAALALAEAVDAAAIACDAPEGTPPDLFQRTWLARCEALTAYRATAPKLRTRAEVDAEIGKVARIWSGSRRPPDEEWLLRLCREETAPEPNAVTDHDADMREERPCGCEESEALKAQLDRCRAIVRSWLEDTIDGKSARIALERELVRGIER